MQSIRVFAGYGINRRLVGCIVAQWGMMTNQGVVIRITPAGTVFTTRGQFRSLARLSTTLTEARKFGYPHANGSERYWVANVRRAGETIAS